MTDGFFKRCVTCAYHCCNFVKGDVVMHIGLTDDEADYLKRAYPDIPAVNGQKGRFFLWCNERKLCFFCGANGCILGDKRPFSCKSYPYATAFINDRYYLIRWTNVCDKEGWQTDDLEAEGIIELFGDTVKTNAFDGKYITDYELIRAVMLYD